MSDEPEHVRQLREALAVSPDNLPLRQALAESLLAAGLAAEAVGEYRAALAASPDHAGFKLGLARAFHAAGKASQALVVAEDLAKLPDPPARALVLHARVQTGTRLTESLGLLAVSGSGTSFIDFLGHAATLNVTSLVLDPATELAIWNYASATGQEAERACAAVSARANGQADAIAAPRRYEPSSSFDRWASIRRTSRRWPFTRAICMES
jgi:tetratricopeptide (TPR) repeat protein